MSTHLSEQKPLLKRLVAELRKEFSYAFVLATDVSGTTYAVTTHTTAVTDSRWAERGYVVRAYKDGRYFEYAFSELSEANMLKVAAAVLASCKDAVSVDQEVFSYPEIRDEKLTDSFYGEVEIPLDRMDAQQKLERLRGFGKKANEMSEKLVNFQATMSNVHVSKLFISENRELEQSYIFSEGSVAAVARRDNNTRSGYDGASGLIGLEILDELEKSVEKVVRMAEAQLDAETIDPGVYEVVCSPAAVGIIAHEAFGHGVEMDMFVKNRAKAAEYIGKPVAAKILNMRDGAASAKHVSSYLFDDEGTIGTDTLIIENGILKAGISDLLSALKLGTVPTGNGKRESFDRKAYTRMTNTFFEPGNDTFEDMIASIKHGYFLDVASSGMEDPKEWGIQLMFLYATEIRDGKLTGNLVAPVVMTGYVPDMLSDITMISPDFKLYGTGACGKGHKEWSKVSDGGPYIKTKARLG